MRFRAILLMSTLTLFSLQARSARADLNIILQTIQDWALVCEDIQSEAGKQRCDYLQQISRYLLNDLKQSSQQACQLGRSPLNLQSILNEAEEFMDTIFSSSKGLPNWNPLFTYQVIRCIENNKTKWMQQCSQEKLWNEKYPSDSNRLSSYSCPIEIESSARNQTAQIRIELGEECHRIFISNLGDFIGKGSFKQFEGAIEYRTWMKLARGQIRSDRMAEFQADEKEQKDHAKEIKILKSINQLPEYRRTGLPETFYADQKRLLQPRYDGDLSKGPLSNPTARNRVITQLSRGLQSLHDLGYVHSDYKPKNALGQSLESSKNSKAVITDFGLAYSANEVAQSNKRHRSGTPKYMAPEQTTRAIQGNTPAEKKENAFKVDVFAHGLVLFHSTWDPSDQNGILKYKNFLSCNARFHINVKEKDFDPPVYSCNPQLQALRLHILSQRRKNPLAPLLAKALHLDPTKRPSSQDFTQAADDAVNQSTFDRIRNGPMSMRSHLICLTQSQAEVQKEGQPWHRSGRNYVIYPYVQADGSQVIRVSYRKKDDTTGFTQLRADPNDAHAIGKEIRKLQKKLPELVQ